MIVLPDMDTTNTTQARCPAFFKAAALALAVLSCCRVAEAARGLGSGAATPLRIVLFHSPGCAECQKVEKALPPVIDHWGPSVCLERKSIEDVAAFNELLLYEKHYGVEAGAPPVVFAGSRCLIGERVIVERLGEVVAEELAKGATTFRASASAASSPMGAMPGEILKHFDSWSASAVAAAGLIDGINPCAFTTIIFLISMLAYLKKTRRQMAAVGISFTVGVFAAYCLLGLGLLGAVKSFSVSHGLSSGLAWGTGILAFALAAWSLLDAIRYFRTGNVKSMTLGLPKSVKDRIHKVIRIGLRTRGLVVGAVGVGFLVSILESLCTGQVYLPTIIFVTRSPRLRADALGYLLLYNLMFIVPLAGILTAAYFGVRSETIGKFLRRRMAAFKLAMAAVFAGLGILVITPPVEANRSIPTPSERRPLAEPARDQRWLIEDDNFAVVIPQRWPGRHFPLLEAMDAAGAELSSGRWLVLLYSHDRPGSREAIQEYEEAAARLTKAGIAAPRIALVEIVPPNVSRPRTQARPDSSCLHGQIKTSKRWSIETPLVVALRDGRVDSVRLLDPHNEGLPERAGGLLSFSQTHIELEQAPNSSPPMGSVTLTNISGDPLFLRVNTTCGCVKTELGSTHLFPGQTTSLTIRLRDDSRATNETGASGQRIIIVASNTAEKQSTVLDVMVKNPAHGKQQGSCCDS
jgi:hypothetical protein